MNDRQLENRVRNDAARVKKDVSTLVEDNAARLEKFGENGRRATLKAREELASWVDDSVAGLSSEFGKLTGDAKETLTVAATAVRKDVGHGLSQYNNKAQELADKVPGGVGQKTAAYPWVAVSIALVLGFLLGALLRPSRLPLPSSKSDYYPF